MVALAAVVVVVLVGVLAVLGSSLFAVEEVTVTGAVYTDQEALDAVIDDLTGTAVLLVDSAAVEARARGDPVGRGRTGHDIVPELGVDRDPRTHAGRAP